MINGTSIPRLKVKAKDIEDDGALDITAIKVDDLDNHTAAHNIVAACPITGNAPVLTLTGNMDCSGFNVCNPGGARYKAGNTVLTQNMTDEIYVSTVSQYLWIPLPHQNIVRGSVIRIKFQGKLASAATNGITLQNEAGASLGTTGNMTTSYAPYVIDITLTVDTIRIISVVLTNGACGAYFKELQICGDVDTDIDFVPVVLP